jgi:hypothetical protein
MFGCMWCSAAAEMKRGGGGYGKEIIRAMCAPAIPGTRPSASATPTLDPPTLPHPTRSGSSCGGGASRVPSTTPTAPTPTLPLTTPPCAPPSPAPPPPLRPPAQTPCQSRTPPPPPPTPSAAAARPPPPANLPAFASAPGTCLPRLNLTCCTDAWYEQTAGCKQKRNLLCSLATSARWQPVERRSHHMPRRWQPSWLPTTTLS